MTHRELKRWNRASSLNAEKVWIGLSWSFAFAIATYALLSVASLASADDIVAHSFDVDASSLLKGEALQIDLGNVRCPDSLETSGERLTVVLAKPLSENLSLSLRSESGESINADMRVIGKRIVCFDKIIISPDCDAVDVINDVTGVSLTRVVVDRNSNPTLTDEENSK